MKTWVPSVSLSLICSSLLFTKLPENKDWRVKTSNHLSCGGLSDLPLRSSLNHKEARQVPSALISAIRAEPYLQTIEGLKQLDRLQIAAVGFSERELSRVFDQPVYNQQRFFEIDALAHSELWVGETSLLVIHKDPIFWDDVALEEMEIRLDGKVRWAEPLRSSGLFSRNILSRRYGRDDADPLQMPHAVVVFCSSPNAKLNKLRKMCEEREVAFYVFGGEDLSLSDADRFGPLLDAQTASLSRPLDWSTQATETQTRIIFADIMERMDVVLKSKLVEQHGLENFRRGLQKGLEVGRCGDQQEYMRGVTDTERRFAESEKKAYLEGYEDGASGHPSRYTQIPSSTQNDPQ